MRWKIRKLLGPIINHCMKNSYQRFKNAFANPPDVTTSDKLRCNSMTSCFSIIGSQLVKDSLNGVYENHKTVSYFQESHSAGTDAMCNGSSTRMCEPWWSGGLKLKHSERNVAVNKDLNPLTSP